MSRLTQILRGKKIKPLTDIEAAVKYAVDNAGSGGGGGSITVDSSLSDSSTNPVENRVITAALADATLPTVTNADNGKVLGVVNGAWDKMEIGGDTLETLVEIPIGTMEYGDGMFASDVRLESEISVPEGANFYFNSTEYPLTFDNETELYIYNIDVADGSVTDITKPGYAIRFTLDQTPIVGIFSSVDLSNTTVTILMDESGGSELPPYSVSDAGKVLGVDSNGELAWVTP